MLQCLASHLLYGGRKQEVWISPGDRGVEKEKSMMKKLLAFTFSRLVFGIILPRKLRKKVCPIAGLAELKRKIDVEQTLRRYLLYFIMPLWMIAGLLDWYHHRRTKIEETAGTHVSLIHLLMMSEVGFPIMVGLEVNALALALMIGAFFAHEATAYWDVAYAASRREVIPFMVVSFMICLYWDQFCALVKVGNEPARFELRTKRQPLARSGCGCDRGSCSRDCGAAIMQKSFCAAIELTTQ
ncbi:MAG: hypothetical protein ACXWPG_13730 [Ktedonobacteraceae bacterium]